MSLRKTVEPTLDEYGDETHPSYGRIRVTRAQGAPRPLFDSETLHQHTITLTISHATRKRDLQRDWIHEGRVVAEVSMSEAQWAQMVSSIGAGPSSCTLRVADGDYMVPDAPFSARLALTAAETRTAAKRALADVEEKLAAVQEKPTKANVRALAIAVGNLPANLQFAADSITKHTEDVVTKARADIEAMAMAAADRYRVDVRELGTGEAAIPQIEAGQ
ncbi:hypothetical protein [Phycicoccus sp.]|uniref:hypothetical protein n=1 Tax=Phycicoccus sp. TaxID=1902410 RepID=UPI002C41933E|nr:hypothetical protein [Phycicoccus sp.]HMM95375.1 hypothetical protein [Phycicoccus sp.]